ncbi:hypothetical protein TPHA_0D04350 [Tetrapisispora phaffii CBS 4417]|uniref:Ubiquitin carboxyl-terminal hydrolase n=1 Tax=Tetrapisispora phaffii (strain ATCC 24235 / CBS 4417 / NBRC 1672 / NRRL Y-8282 / UCD 70-5) TaxID=1071381 RepID=G8BRZ4_TETPH|nr:hypothetical protein TPHA_0D04350 [Tetrapisispora phaffii CBS 4417]CCE63069.1 hypothetical protein TPHA_0D04350 [Tetrapisispora phaffii CBS 4417]
MSEMDSQDNSEESYSMYPKTSSPPPPPPGPHQSGMHFSVYQPAVPMYSYPQTPYMYTGQMPSYGFNMMGQNQMMYQHNAIPQSGTSDGKKKWNHGNANGTMANGKVHHYQASQHTTSYHPHSAAGGSAKFIPSNKSNSSSSSSVNFSNPSASASFNPQLKYKFDISKSNAEEVISSTSSFPLFFNTNEKEFAEARKIRQQLRMKTLDRQESSSVVAPSEEQNDTPEEKKSIIDGSTKTEDIKESEKLKQEVNNVPEPVNDKVEKSAGSENISQETTIETDKKVEKVSQSNATATSVSASTSISTSSTSSKTISKSWSAIASNAINKSRTQATLSATSNILSSPSIASSSSSVLAATVETTAQSQVQVPQKKDKKYVPPSNVGIEPLGATALRICYDPDFIIYVLKQSEKSLPIKNIVPRGIINSANICFMSSVLQVLLSCAPFINILNVVSINSNIMKPGVNQTKLLDACIKLYSRFDKESFEAEKEKEKDNESSSKKQSSQYNAKATAISPEEFYKVLSTISKFKDLKWGHQEDAEEFLTHLLDQLHEEFISVIESLTNNEVMNLINSISDEELKIFVIKNIAQYTKAGFNKTPSPQLKALLNKYSSSIESEGDGWHEVSGSSKKGKKTKTAAKRTVEVEPSPISNLFGGQFRSVLDIPNNKESQSITLDPFQTIQLDISDKETDTIESAFKKFSEYELLPFKASSGNDVEAKKQTFIDRLPQVLLVQLKRFSFVNNEDKDNNMMNYNSINGRIEKIRKKISYGHELVIPEESLSPHSWSQTNRKYQLTGVIYHHGLSSDGGHYTADVFNKTADKWYRIDDINITELKKDDVLKGGEDGTDTRTAYILMYQKL